MSGLSGKRTSDDGFEGFVEEKVGGCADVVCEEEGENLWVVGEYRLETHCFNFNVEYLLLFWIVHKIIVKET